MISLRRTILVEREPAAVFALLSATWRHAEFFAGVTRWEPRGEIQGRIGDRFRFVIRVGSIEVGGYVRIDELEPSRRIGWVSETGFNHRGRWTCRSVPGGTEVGLELEFELRGLGASLVERLSGRILERNLRATLLGVKHRLEYEGGRRARGVTGAAADPGTGGGSVLDDLKLGELVQKLPGASLLGAIGDVADTLRAAYEAGILSGGSLQGGLEILRRAAAVDFHPAAVWAIHTANLGDTPALVQGSRSLGWRQANERINRLANGLRSLGVRPGDRVACMLENSIEWVETMAATQKIGASIVFVSYRYTAPEVQYLCENSGATALVFGAKFGGVIAEARKSLGIGAERCVQVGGAKGALATYEELLEKGSAEEPPAELRKKGGSKTIQYTSGTTGKPKGAVRDLSKAGIATFIGLLRRIPFRRSDRHLVAAPLYHATGSGFAAIHLTLGATLHIMGKFDAEEFLATVDREKVTTSALVPTMLQAIATLPEEVRSKYDVSSIRIIVTTGSALPQKLERIATETFGEVLYDLYGSTEMGYVTVATPQDKKACPGTIGKPIPGVDVVLLSENREPVPDGEVGELFARSSLTVEGYHADEEATRKSRWGDYFSVGDLAVRDPRGYLTLVGRKTDMVISGGMNIYPAEIEECLTSHPKIAEAGVVGVPDEKWGESLVAFVVPRRGETVTAGEIEAHCRRSLAGYKIPRRIELSSELPRNPTGKILKNELKARAAAG